MVELTVQHWFYLNGILKMGLPNRAGVYVHKIHVHRFWIEIVYTYKFVYRIFAIHMLR